MKRRLYLGMHSDARSIKYLLYWLIAGSKGGSTRLKIIDALKHASLNTNQLAVALKISYKTIKGHLEVLEKNKLIVRSANYNGVTTYVLSRIMQENYNVFEELSKKVLSRG